MSLIDFPDVPNVPGVPNIARSGITVNETNILSAIQSGDLLSIIDSMVTPRWSIHDEEGNSVIVPDTVVEFEYKNESQILTYPVEQGGFATYNKVASPYDIRMKMACSGSLGLNQVSWSSSNGLSVDKMTRASFLDQLDNMLNTLNLYDIVTPDVVYQKLNMIHYDYKRTSSNGVTLLVVDAFFQEVRVSGNATYDTVKQPSASTTVNRGGVRPLSPTDKQQSLYDKTISDEDLF